MQTTNLIHKPFAVSKEFFLPKLFSARKMSLTISLIFPWFVAKESALKVRKDKQHTLMITSMKKVYPFAQNI